MQIEKDYFTTVIIEPHERVLLTTPLGEKKSVIVQVDAFSDGTLMFSGGDDIILDFVGINPNEIKIYDTPQPFLVVGTSKTIVVNPDDQVVLATTLGKQKLTCIYINNYSDDKLTFTGGQGIIHGVQGININKFGKMTEKEDTPRF